ncbi:MAG: DUF4340 domain-containing protein [Myxococcaceae bacterium]
MSQTRKLLLQLAVFVLVAAGLGSYAWFGIFKKDEHEKRKQDHDLRLFAPQKLDERQADGGSPPAEWTRLSVTVKGVTTLLERREKDWVVVSPVQTRADKLIVDGLLSQLQNSKFKDTLEEDPDPATLEKYGLKDPEFVVEASAMVNGEQRSVKVIGGKENTFDGTVYVRRNDEKPVFTAEGGVRFMLARSTFDLRDKQPFHVDEAKVQRITLKSKFNAWELARDGKQWNLVKPNAEPADGPTITAMLGAASSERAQEFFTDDTATRARLGFDAPLVDVTLTLDGDKPVRLRAQREAVDGGERYYGLREDGFGTSIALLGPGITQFDRNAADLHDRAIVRFKRELVTKIVLHDPASPDVVLQKDAVDASAESWRVVAPREGKAKVFKVTGALWMLGAFKALAAGEEKPKDWARYGLDGKGRSITVFGEDGKELGRLLVGKEVIGKPTTFYVRGTRDQVFESDGSRFGELPFTLADVLDEPGLNDAGVVDAGR